MTITPSPTPTPNSPAVLAATTADAIAEELRAIVDTLQTAVPGLLKFDARQVRRIAASAKFGSASLVPTITVVSSVPKAKDRDMFDVKAGRLALQYRDQVLPLAKQIGEFAADLEFTIDNMLAAAAVQSLQTYRWAQHVARQPDGADLQSYVDQMSGAVKKTMNHRKPAAAAPKPTPAPGGAKGFLPIRSSEPQDIADRFDQALRDVTE
ncbi:MAG TPA: hypothetical protein VGA84_01480 [Thermoanaerobaculia bacterium]